MSGLHFGGALTRQGGGGQEAQRRDCEGAIGELPAVQLAGAGETAPNQHARAFGQPVVGREALGRVVVAGDGGHLDAGGDQPADRGPEERHRFGGGNVAVVDVAGDDDQLGALGDGEVDQPIAKHPLVVDQRVFSQASPEMPVAGVDELHANRPYGWGVTTKPDGPLHACGPDLSAEPTAELTNHDAKPHACHSLYALGVWSGAPPCSGSPAFRSQNPWQFVSWPAPRKGVPCEQHSFSTS